MSRFRSSRQPRSAFTLIELLLNIVIMALLAAILLPVFGRVRETARRSTCQSNLRQIGLGIMQYTQDYDETYPWAWNGAGNWGQTLQPYLKSTQVFVCPTNTASKSNMDKAVGLPIIPRSYGANTRIIGQNNNSIDKYPPIMLAKLISPSQKIMVSETAVQWQDMGSPWWSLATWSGAMDDGSNGKFVGHLKTANYLFADGHVKSLRPLNTATPFNMWGYQLSAFGGVCTEQSINCDTPEPVIINGLNAIESKFN